MQDKGHVVIDHPLTRAAKAGKAGKVRSLSRFRVSIRSQPVKKFGVRILDLAWLKFAKLALLTGYPNATHKITSPKKYLMC